MPGGRRLFPGNGFPQTLPDIRFVFRSNGIITVAENMAKEAFRDDFICVKAGVRVIIRVQDQPFLGAGEEDPDIWINPEFVYQVVIKRESRIQFCRLRFQPVVQTGIGQQQ